MQFEYILTVIFVMTNIFVSCHFLFLSLFYLSHDQFLLVRGLVWVKHSNFLKQGGVTAKINKPESIVSHSVHLDTESRYKVKSNNVLLNNFTSLKVGMDLWNPLVKLTNQRLLGSQGEFR